MRRTFLVLLLCGCATAGNTTEEEITPRQAAIFSSAETGQLLADRPTATAITIAAPPATVWLAVRKVYADLEIPLTVDNPAAHQIGNPMFYRSRQFDGQPMAQLVDCGTGMTGPKAASYRIYMSLLTSVVTDGNGGTKVQTTFVPMGQDMSGSSSDRFPCGTSGRLEALFLEQVKATIGKP